MDRRLLSFVVIAVITLILDQVTKFWVYWNLRLGVDQIEVIPGFFAIEHAQNPGAVFSFLADWEYRHFLFLGFTVVAVVVILQTLRALPRDALFLPLTLGLLMAGALGNAIDRVHKGSVTDFLLIYTDNPALSDWLIDRFRTNQWPTFNVADMALVIGVGLFVIHSLFLEEAEAPAKSPEAPAGSKQ